MKVAKIERPSSSCSEYAPEQSDDQESILIAQLFVRMCSAQPEHETYGQDDQE